MKKNPILSIVIPTFNSGNVICKCLDSIFQNKTSFEYEIILSDDGSNDDILNIVSPYLAKNKNTRIIKNSHKGAQNARLKGLLDSKGQIVFFLDSDDQISSNFIERVCETFVKRKFDLLLINAICVSKEQKEILISPETFKYVSDYSAFQESVVFGRLGFNCCHVFSRSVLEKVDWTSLEELSYTEDLNLYITILKNNNLDVYILDETIYFYNFENHKLSQIITRKKIESAIYVIKKRYSLVCNYFSAYKNTFVKSSFPLVVDWMRAIKSTRKFSRKEKNELKNILKTDVIISDMNSIYTSLNKSMKEKLKYLFYWIL